SSLSSYRVKLIFFLRSLGDIEKRCQRLSEKKKVAKMLDKKRDSGAIAKLIEQLRQAILIYQVGTTESRRPCRIDSFSIVVATAVYRESGRTIDCKSHSSVFT